MTVHTPVVVIHRDVQHATQALGDLQRDFRAEADQRITVELQRRLADIQQQVKELTAVANRASKVSAERDQVGATRKGLVGLLGRCQALLAELTADDDVAPSAGGERAV